MIVVISGLIGVGKTTLCKSLCDYMKATPYYEPVESNPFLQPYLHDPVKYSYPMQINLLFERTKAFEDALNRSLDGELCIMDRSMYEDWAFADVQYKLGYMEKSMYDSYIKWHRRFTNRLPLPDLILYLETSVKTALNRQGVRAREGEENYDDTYIKALETAYKDLLPRLECKCPVVTIDAERTCSAVFTDAFNAICKRRDEIDNTIPIYHGGL